MEKIFHYDPKTQVQVLSPMRKGAMGIEELNEQMRLKHLNCENQEIYNVN